jgi:uncharacterized protein (TIGR02246 family)
MRALALLLVLTSTAFADSKADEAALRELPKSFCAAWAKHDAHELARMMADDVDFVTVGAVWLHGKADFEKYHGRLLTGRFKESGISRIDTAVRFLRPELAVVHWTWSIQGDRDPDGTPRKPRFGLMTMVVEKRKGAWLVVASQNTNAMPGGPPPELEGITTPIPVPGTAK